MTEKVVRKISFNCGGNQVEAEISSDTAGVPRIELVGPCGKLNGNNQCDGDYCMLKTRVIKKEVLDDGLDDGEEEIIDLDPDDI